MIKGQPAIHGLSFSWVWRDLPQSCMAEASAPLYRQPPQTPARPLVERAVWSYEYERNAI